MAYQYETVKLDKGMYSEAGRSFTKVLEQCDPSEQYKGTPLEHLDAFQRQLKRFDIRVKGSESDVVAKFFATWESAVLFPEYVARAVRQGMEETDILPQITAAETRVSGMDYRSIASTPGDEAKELKRVEEGAVIPETRVKAQENLVRLHKRGRMLVASYEAIQFQRLDLFSVTLRQIGAYINRMHAADAIDVLMNGDGNNNAAQVFTVGSGPISGTAGTLSYDALVDFWSQFAPYALNTLVVGDAMADILKLKEMQDGTAGLTFQGTGKLVTPMGATLVRSSAVPAGTILGLDKNYALELVRASDVLVEYDKLIDRQLERAAITSISGFAKIFQDAAKGLKLGGEDPLRPVRRGTGRLARTAARGRDGGGLRRRADGGLRLGGAGGHGDGLGTWVGPGGVIFRRGPLGAGNGRADGGGERQRPAAAGGAADGPLCQRRGLCLLGGGGLRTTFGGYVRTVLAKYGVAISLCKDGRSLGEGMAVVRPVLDRE